MRAPSQAERAGGEGSRARLVRAAYRLLSERGYAATGVKEIAVEGAAPMGSFYFHFPGGKEELAALAMGHGAARFARLLERALNSSDDLGACYERVATMIAERMAASRWAYGCPVATTALETVGTNPALQTAAQSAFTAWREVLTERAVRAGVPDDRAETLACNALALLEGAELLARVERSSLPLEHAAAALAALARAEQP